MKTQTKYGFKVGQIVTNRINLQDETGHVIPAYTELRIVAFTPKVTRTRPERINASPGWFDSKLFFVNLVVATQKEDYGNRIREHFVTIKKV